MEQERPEGSKGLFKKRVLVDAQPSKRSLACIIPPSEYIQSHVPAATRSCCSETMSKARQGGLGAGMMRLNMSPSEGCRVELM
jgi:hypothetical protein